MFLKHSCHKRVRNTYEAVGGQIRVILTVGGHSKGFTVGLYPFPLSLLQLSCYMKLVCLCTELWVGKS